MKLYLNIMRNLSWLKNNLRQHLKLRVLAREMQALARRENILGIAQEYLNRIL